MPPGSKKDSKKRNREPDPKEPTHSQPPTRQVRLRESEVFTRLQQFERQIDEVVRLTRIDYNATRASPKTASLTPRIPKTLLLEVKTELRHAPDERTAPTLPQQWSLTLTGRLLDRVPKGGQPLPARQREHAKQLCRMSDVVQRVVIKLDPDHEPAGTSCVEWTRPFAAAGASENDARAKHFGHFDGLTLTRPVRDIRPFDVEILIELRFEPARFKLSEPLRRLLGIHTDTRQRVIKALYEHCKAKRLFDPATGAIHATPEIAAVFIPRQGGTATNEIAPAGVKVEQTGAVRTAPARGESKVGAASRPTLTWDEITEGLNFHLSAPDVLRLRHRVELLPPPVEAMVQPHSLAQNPECNVHTYKVDLDLDDRIVEYLEPPQFIKKVQEIDEKLEKMYTRIVHARKTHDFFRRLSTGSDIGLRQLFMMDFDKKLEQHKRAAGYANPDEKVDLFLKRRANLFNLGWVESTIPTLLELRQEVSPWVAAAQLQNGEHGRRSPYQAEPD